MKNLCLWIPITLVSLQSYVMSEAQSVKEDVSGAVGGAVTLHLCYTGAKSIAWNLVKGARAIARTKPQESPEIDDSNYVGRLNSTPDGSLIITELRLEDQGIYKAQSLIDQETKICHYHLTVFSNLTAENVTINPNVTDNKTCEVSLTCLVDSVDETNVNIIWRSLNISNVNQTENVVFVPPSNVNFTYICTAKNPVSNVSKNVVPWLLYCNHTHNYSPTENSISTQTKTIIIITVFIGIAVFVATLLLIPWFVEKLKKKSGGANTEKAALKQIANTYEMSDEDCTGNNEALVDENAESGTPNVKKPMTGTAGMSNNPHNAGSETQNVKKPMTGTAGMSNNPHKIELQESQSNETTDKTLYSTVQHVKEPQESQSNFTTSNTVYSAVQHQKSHFLCVLQDKNKKKSPPEEPNGNCSNAPLESCYAEVQLPKDKSHQKAPLESCYAEVQLPKVQVTGSKSSNQ
ncbi:uncharacterized protein LOC143942193 [Lithobates pipiens]